MVISSLSLLADALESLNVKTAFGIVGLPIVDAWDIVHKKGNTQVICCRQEQSAAVASACYNYLAGPDTTNVSCCFTTGGPGFVAALAGVAFASANRLPLVLITSVTSRSTRGKGEFQEFPAEGVATALIQNKECKGLFSISKMSATENILGRAFSLAYSGVPGPVIVCMEGECFIEQDDAQKSLDSATNKNDSQKIVITKPMPKQEDCDTLATWLWEAKKPLIIIGKGYLFSSNDSARLISDVSKFIPVLCSPWASGCAGSANACRSFVLSKADRVCFVGARNNWIFAFGEKGYAPGAEFAVVDVDPDASDFYRLKVVGDGSEAMKQLGKIFLSYEGKPQIDNEWFKQIDEQAEINKKRAQDKVLEHIKGEKMTMDSAMQLVGEKLGKSAATIIAEGQTCLASSRIYVSTPKEPTPRGRLDPGTSGMMGMGLGGCLAAGVLINQRQKERREHFVLGIMGDSAFGFSSMELETIRRYALPVIVVVMDNEGIYGSPGDDPSGVRALSKAHSFAMHWDANNPWYPARSCTTMDQLRAALQESTEEGGTRICCPSLIDCKVYN